MIEAASHAHHLSRKSGSRIPRAFSARRCWGPFSGAQQPRSLSDFGIGFAMEQWKGAKRRQDYSLGCLGPGNVK